MCDGAIISILSDQLHTERAIEHLEMMKEGIKPIILLEEYNQFMEDNKTVENYEKMIENLNNAVKNLKSEKNGFFDPVEGNIIFGSAYNGWGFTLDKMATIYHKKFKISKEKFKKKLFGNHFYDPKNKAWVIQNTTGDLKTGFQSFVIDPILRLIKLCKNNKPKAFQVVKEKLGLTISESLFNNNSYSYIFNEIMKIWLPLDEEIFNQIVFNVPSPFHSQSLRLKHYFDGNTQGNYFKSISCCNPDSPLLVYVSNLVPSKNNKSKFFALGRVFSGKITAKENVQILKKNENNVIVRKINNLSILMGENFQNVSNVKAGNFVLIEGIENTTDNATIIGENNAYCNRLIVNSFFGEFSNSFSFFVKPENELKISSLESFLKNFKSVEHNFSYEKKSSFFVVSSNVPNVLQTCFYQLEQRLAHIPLDISQKLEICESISNKTFLFQFQQDDITLHFSCQPISKENLNLIKQKNLHLIQDSNEIDTKNIWFPFFYYYYYF